MYPICSVAAAPCGPSRPSSAGPRSRSPAPVCRRRWTALAALLVAGCQLPRIDPGAEQAIERAIGLPAGAIEFRFDPVEAAATPDRLTLAEAVQRAVGNSQELQAALARVRMAAADADQARLLANPVLSLVCRWGAGLPQIEAGLTATLVEALQMPARARAADNRLRQAAAAALTTALDVVAAVQERYARVQALDALVPLLAERLELMRSLVAVAQNRLEAGFGAQADVTALDAERVALEVEIDGAALQRREQRLRLSRELGEPAAAAAWQLDAWTPPSVALAGEAAWLDAAVRHRPELQALAWRLAALGDDVATARLAAFDGLALGIDAQRDGDWAYGPALALPLPVFDGGGARRDRLTAEQSEARHQWQGQLRLVVEEVRTAHVALAANLQNLRRMQQQLIPLQQQRRQQAEELYRAGETDATALFLAEQDLRAAQARAIDIELQSVLALTRLQRAVGGPAVAAATGPTP